MQAYSLGQGNSALVRKYSPGWSRSRAVGWHRNALLVQAFTQTEAPSRPIAAADLKPAQAELLCGLKGPLVKITAHYHVNFGDSLKVIGNSEDFGMWDALTAPSMHWGEGDVWSLVLPVSPGEHEFKVVVQKGDGGLMWEDGINRKVVIPEDAPFGSMLVADCVFNYAEMMAEPVLQPVSEDALQLLEAQAEAEMVAEIEATSKELAKQQVSEAAAAVAKALATLDAEAEETVRRSLVTSDEEEQFVSVTTAETVEIEQDAGREAQDIEDAQDADITGKAQAEVEPQSQASASEVHPPETAAGPSSTPAASVHAKLAQDKPVAIGFLDTSALPEAAPASKDAADGTSSVVAAFMKSVAKKPALPSANASPAPADAPPAPADTPAVEGSSEVAGDDSIPAKETPLAASAELEPTPDVEPTPDIPTTPTNSPRAGDASPARSEFAAEFVTDVTASSAAAKVVTDVTASPAASEVVADVTASSAASEVVADVTASEAASEVVMALPTPPATSTSPAANNNNSKPDSALSIRDESSSAAGSASSSPQGSRPPSPGRGSSRVAAATAAAAMDWVEGVKSNGVVAKAREAEEAAKAKAARLEAAQKAKSAAAAESAKLNQDLDSRVKGRGSASGSPQFRLSPEAIAAAGTAAAGTGAAMPAPPEVISAAQDKGYTVSSAAAAAAVPGLSPPPISSSNISRPQAKPSRMPALATASLDAAVSAANVEAADDLAADTGDWNVGMQMLSAVVGCAAVGTVLWSEFVLKDTGCGLPPGPYGLLGAAEGLSYLAVLGFAGAGLAARGTSGGKQGLPGVLAVPEMMAYGALAAGLLVLASQLHDYGYIPPPLPGGQCYPDAAVGALPGTDELSAQLAAQLAALQAILSQLKSAAAEGIDSLQLQQQLSQLQSQVDSFSAYVATQASTIDAQLQSGLVQLQDSLSNATTAVSSFVDTQLHQLDIPGKLAFVVDVLKKQEQQLVVELPKQFAELQKLAASATAMVQETALQAANASHLPELLASLDKSMGVLHDVLEIRIQQLDSVLTQVHDSCAAAASQLATAATAAHEAGLKDASAQLAHLQALLSDAMLRVQDQVWAGYQQLALADHLSDMLLKIRSSAAEVAASTTAEVEKLHLQQQLTELEAIAESSVTALSANAMDQLSKLELEQRLAEIEQQAATAAVSLKNGLVQQYNEQVPVLQQRLVSLEDSLAGWAADAQRGVQQQNVDELLHQLQQSMEATAKAVREIAVSGADTAGHQLQVASSSLNSNLEQLSGSVSNTINSSSQSISKAVTTAVDTAASAAKTAAAPVQQVASSAPSVVRSAAASNPAALPFVQDELAAYTPDIDAVKQLWEADDFLAPGVDLRDASDAVKAIWANRPQ